MLLSLAKVSVVYRIYVGLLRGLVTVAVILSLIVSGDRVLKVARHALVVFRIRWSGQKPEQRFSSRPLPEMVAYSSLYPSVAIQLPMYNVRALLYRVDVCLAYQLYFCVLLALLLRHSRLTGKSGLPSNHRLCLRAGMAARAPLCPGVPVVQIQGHVLAPIRSMVD